MSAAIRGPGTFPRFRVAEKVHFTETLCVGALNRQVGENLEWGAIVVRAVVSGFEQEETVRIAGAVRHCDSTAANRQEKQSQPSAIRRALGKGGVKASDG